MKIPTLFVPENKDLDKKLEDIIKKPDKMQIQDINHLADLPEMIDKYVQRTQPNKIKKEYWWKYFGNLISQYITEAIEITYIEPRSTFFTFIRILKLKNKTLDDANKRLYLKVGLNYNGEMMEIINLKKGNYIVTLRKNKFDVCNSLEIIGNYYRENFGLEEL